MSFVECRKLIIFICLIVLVPCVADAKITKDIKGAVKDVYKPAVPHAGLEDAQQPIEPEFIKSYVVVEKDNLIPADRAFYMITPQYYEYRGAVVVGDRVKTRAGKPYMYLPKGTIMAVVDDVFSGNSVYVKLISPKIMKSPTFPKKKPTRVTVMFGIKFDKAELESGSAKPVIARLKEWIKPFYTYSKAYEYSQGMKSPAVDEAQAIAPDKDIKKPRMKSSSPRWND